MDDRIQVSDVDLLSLPVQVLTTPRLYALSLHETALSVETWQRAKALDDQRRALLI